MGRISRSSALSGLGAVLALACTAPTIAQPAPLRLGSSTSGDGFSFPFYAAELGIFKRAGLNIEMTDLPNAGAISTALAGRALDVGFTDPINVANAFNRGVSWAFFAGGPLYTSEASTTVMTTLPNSPVRTAKDLEGKAIGVVSLASVSTLGTRAWLQSNGADLTKVKLLELSFPTMVPAMQRGDLAAALIAEPVLSQVKSEVRPLANAFDAIAKSFLIAACFSTREWLAANPALARRLAAALDETARYANAHQDETGVVLAKGSKLPIDVVKTMTRVRYGRLEARLIEPILVAAAKYGAIEKPVAASAIIVNPA